MGPQDHLRALHDGADCTVCDAHVPADRIRLLARRDDLLFLQVVCPSCGSTALGFVADTAGLPEADRLAGSEPVDADDVLDMHALLESWSGDLASLVGGRPIVARPAPGRATTHDSRPTGRPG